MSTLLLNGSGGLTTGSDSGSLITLLSPWSSGTNNDWKERKKKLHREVTVTSVHPFLPQGLTFETMQHFDMTIDVWSIILAHQTKNDVVDNQGKSGFDWYNNWFLHSKLNGKTIR